MNDKQHTPGTAFGTGRPATGRTHPITIRVSDEAFGILRLVKNKSGYIDTLIRLNPSKTNAGSSR